MEAQKNHPKELPILFLTEMWERYAFYLMLGIFLLFMIDKDRGGMGLPYDYAANQIFGTYIAMVYLFTFVGGMIADKWLGYRKAIVAGAALMASGYFMLAIHSPIAFYGALGLIVIGNGFFKPNISALLGRLYPDKSPHTEDGFRIFYVGINVGAFVCTFVAAYIRNKWGWGPAFASAGVGMLIGLVTFLTVYKSLERGERQKTVGQDNADEHEAGEMGMRAMGAVLVAMIACYLIGLRIWDGKYAFYMAVMPAVCFFGWLWHKSREKEKGPLGALLVICVVLVPFWMNFNLYGTTLTKISEDDTRRHVSTEMSGLMEQAEWLQHATPSYFNNAAPNVPRPDRQWLHVVIRNSQETDEDYGKRVDEQKSANAKAVIAKGYRGAGPVPVKQEEYDAVYAKAGSTTLDPGVSLKLVNPELMQSINPGLVICLTPLITAFWLFRRKRGKDATIPTQMGSGMFLAAGAMLVMLGAVYVGHDFYFKNSMWWLFWAYFVMTVGELCLSPIGLSLVRKLAPKRMSAVMMGCFFLSIAVGNKLSGLAGSYWKKPGISNDEYFMVLALIAVAFGIIIFMLRRWLNTYIPPQEEEEKKVA